MQLPSEHLVFVRLLPPADCRPMQDVVSRPRLMKYFARYGFVSFVVLREAYALVAVNSPASALAAKELRVQYIDGLGVMVRTYVRRTPPALYYSDIWTYSGSAVAHPGSAAHAASAALSAHAIAAAAGYRPLLDAMAHEHTGAQPVVKPVPSPAVPVDDLCHSLWSSLDLGSPVHAPSVS